MALPCELELILHLSDLRRELEATQLDLSQLRSELTEALSGPESVEALHRERNDLTDRIADLGMAREGLEEDVEDQRVELEARRGRLRERRERLMLARELERRNKERLVEEEDQAKQQESTLSALGSSSSARRTQLITQLTNIFPIEPSPHASSSSSLLFTILSLPLPNSSYPSSLSDETLSSALSYSAQLVLTLSLYLSVPLAYPIRCQGSRSAIMDLISSMRGPRAFPLYRKGVEGYRFDYAVFLLNKNIEQLMATRGLLMTDLRNTLPNLKTLVLSLSYDPSHKDFATTTFNADKLFATSAEEQQDTPPTTANGDANGHSPLHTDSPIASPTLERQVHANGKGPASERSISPASTVRARSRSNTVQSSRTIHAPAAAAIEKHHQPPITSAEERMNGEVGSLEVVDEAGAKQAEVSKVARDLGTVRARGRGGWAVDVGGVAGSVSGAVGSFWRGAGGTAATNGAAS